MLYLQPDDAVTETFNRIKCMATNEGVTNRSADDTTLYCGSAEYFRAADWQWIFVLGSLYFQYLYDSISTWYNIDDTKPAE